MSTRESTIKAVYLDLVEHPWSSAVEIASRFHMSESTVRSATSVLGAIRERRKHPGLPMPHYIYSLEER